MKAIYTLKFLIAFVYFSYSQQWQWAYPINGNGGSWILNVQTDSIGSPYFMGICTPQTSFNGQNGLYSLSGYKSFIASYGHQGNIKWISGGSGYPRSISIDGKGNSYFTGGFNGTAFFGRETYTLQNTSFNNTQDDFLSKLDPTGKAIFFKVQGEACNDEGTSVNSFGNNDIIITGYDQTYCNGAGTWTTYFKKVNSLGNEIWSLNPPISFFTEDPIARTKDDGFILASIYGAQAVSFAGLVDTISLPPGIDGSDAFIAKYNLAGNIKWVKTINGKNYQFSSNVAIDNSNNIITAIESLDTCYIDAVVLLPKGGRTLHLIKTDSLGNYIKHISFNSSRFPPHFWIHDLKSDAQDNIYLVAETDTTLNVGVTTLDFNLLPNEKAIAIIKFDSNFNFLWSQYITTLKWSNPSTKIVISDTTIYIGLNHDANVKLNESNFQFPGMNSTSHNSFVGAIYITDQVQFL